MAKCEIPGLTLEVTSVFLIIEFHLSTRKSKVMITLDFTAIFSNIINY